MQCIKIVELVVWNPEVVMKWLFAIFFLLNFVQPAEARLVVGAERSDVQTLFSLFSLSTPDKEKLLSFSQGIQMDNDHLTFAPMDLEKALEIGLNGAERAAFNQEIDRINLIQMDALEFSAEDRASPTMAKIIEASLSANAFSAVQKILQHSLQKN
jgi:hypothetical protein